MIENLWSMVDPDLALLHAIAAGDSVALQELYTRHGLGLLNYLMQEIGERPIAEEVLQEVMLAVWKQAGRFRGESQVRTWVFAIARRQAIKARQRHRRRPPVEPELSGVDRDEVLALEKALDELPTDQQVALELVFYSGLTGPEAARHLGIPLNTLKSRLHRARHALRRLLSQEDNHE